MKSIKSIRIQNFRTHKDTTVKFSPRVTTITGNSDRGKSNLIRAIRWIALNRPTGTSYIRWGKAQAKVRLSILRHSTCRIRGKKRNLYRLDGETYEAFSNNVPDPIAKLLRMADINFQLQHDPHFWFNLSAGEVSRQLNKIVSLDVIDKTLSNLNAKVAKAKTTVEISQDRLKEAKERRKQLQYAKEMKSDTEHLINLQQKRDRLERSVGDLGQLIETVQVCKQRLENSREVSKNVHKDWEYVRLTRKQHKIVDSRLSDLDEAVIWAEICKTVFSQSCHRLNKARKQLDKVRGSRCPLCNQKVK